MIIAQHKSPKAASPSARNERRKVFTKMPLLAVFVSCEYASFIYICSLFSDEVFDIVVVYHGIRVFVGKTNLGINRVVLLSSNEFDSCSALPCWFARCRVGLHLYVCFFPPIDLPLHVLDDLHVRESVSLIYIVSLFSDNVRFWD